MTRLLFALLFLLSTPLAAQERLPDLAALAGGQQQEFLHPDKAFMFDAVVEDGAVRAHWVITEGYYLYRDKTRFQVEGAGGVTLGEAVLPPGEDHEDEFFGKQRVYRKEATVRVPFTGTGDFVFKVTYQGCADAGLCYPPITKTVALSGAGGGGAAAAPLGADAPEQDRLAEVVRSGSVLTLIGVFFLAGLALTFTPCVLPMIPILSGIIAGQGAKATPARSFLLSLTYVLAMALTYTLAGVLAGLFGQNLQAALQDPLVLGTFALLFVALAFSMFGYYELQMPAAVQSRLAALSNKQEGGTWLGVGVMGVLSALIVGPCVTAPLVAALVVIGQTGDPVRGGVALFALSMGMGVPLLLVGTSLGKLIPRAGGWMETVKQVFGIGLLGVALWFARTLLPDVVVMLAWGGLALGLGLLLGALEPARGAAILRRVIALGFLLWGLAIVVGTAVGNRDPLSPLQGVGSGGAAAEQHLAFKRVKTVADLEREVAAAAAAGKPVMFDFYADWCVACKEMEKYTFPRPEVQAALGDTVLLQADVTANDAEDQALLAHFGIFGPPSILFFGRDGQELRGARVVGYMPAAAFASHLQRTLTKDGAS